MAIGGADAVVFDFAPQIDIGAEILSRRGEDQRFAEERPAAQRRREKDRAVSRTTSRRTIDTPNGSTGWPDA